MTCVGLGLTRDRNAQARVCSWRNVYFNHLELLSLAVPYTQTEDRAARWARRNTDEPRGNKAGSGVGRVEIDVIEDGWGSVGFMLEWMDKCNEVDWYTKN